MMIVRTISRNSQRIIMQQQQRQNLKRCQEEFHPRYFSTIFSLLKKPSISLPSSSTTTTSIQQLESDLDHSAHMVKNHDPAGFLPGKLLPTNEMQITYYAVRSFWVETGLRFGTTAMVPPNSTPSEHLDWWGEQLDTIYNNRKVEVEHPTMRLLSHLVQQHDLTKCHFEDILKGRNKDLQIKQYETLTDLKEHAIWSCGSLSQLILESDGLYQHSNAPLAHKAAKLVGTCHGLTNALRTSIPVVSITGKLIIPHDLCIKYDVKNPRYLLSALGQGDAKCIAAMQNAVHDICNTARDHLQKARELQFELPIELSAAERQQKSSSASPIAVLLPALASEAWLDRL